MATRKQLETALINADKAGDTNAARMLAGAITSGDFDSGFDVDVSPVPVSRGFIEAGGGRVENPLGTYQGSEQSRLLAEQTPGQIPFDEQGRSTQTGAQLIPDVPVQRQQRADVGVDISSGVPASLRAKTSLVPKGDQPTFIKENLQKSLGYETEVRSAPNGDIEFLKKTDDGKYRWTSFDETGLSVGDFAAIAETGPALIGDIAGSIGAGMKTTGLGAAIAVPVEAAGAAVGTAIGEASRLGLGKGLGYHEEDVLPLALQEGGKAGLASLIGGSVVGAGQRLARGFTGGVSGGEIKTILSLDDPNMVQVQDAINLRLREGAKDSQVKLTSGERSLDPAISDIEALARTRSSEAEAAGRKLEIEQQEGFSDFFDLMTGNRSDDYYGAGIEAKKAISEPAKQRLLEIRQRAKNYTDDATGRFEQLDSLDVSKMAEDMRLSAIEQRRLVKEVESAKWQQIEKDSGYNPDTDRSQVIIPTSDGLTKAISRMSIKTKNALFSAESKLKKQLIDGGLSGEQIQILGAKGEILSTVLKPGKSEFDIVPLNRSISYLKKLKRQSDSGLHPDLPASKDINDLLSPLEEMRNTYLAKNNPELLKTIQDAQQLTVDRVKTFDTGPIGKILRKNKGQYFLDDKGVLSTVFAKNNGQAAREYASALIKDPRAMQGARNHIFAIYRNQVMKDGIPDRKLHKKFMSEFEGVMGPFFNQTDLKKMRSLGRTTDVIASYQRKLDKAEKGFEKTFRGRLDDMSPENTIPAFFNKEFSINDVAKIRDYMRTADPKSFDRYRESISSEIRHKMTSSKGRFSSEKIDKLLKDTGDTTSIGKLTKVYGKQFVYDLRALSKLVKASEKRGKAITETSKQGKDALVAKAVLGPLHPRSRLITFFDRLRSSADNKVLYDIMTNPEKLRKVLKNKDIDSRSRRAYQLYSSIGALTSMQEEEQ